MNNIFCKYRWIIVFFGLSTICKGQSFDGEIWKSSEKENVEVSLKHKPEKKGQVEFSSGLIMGENNYPYRIVKKIPEIYGFIKIKNFAEAVKFLGDPDQRFGLSNSWSFGRIEYKLETWTFVSLDESVGNILKVEAQFERETGTKIWKKVTSDYFIGRVNKQNK